MATILKQTLLKRARQYAELHRSVYEVALSSDLSVIRKLILNVPYKLHLGDADVKAELSGQKGNLDFKKLADLHTAIRNSKTGDESEQLEKLSKRTELSEFNKIDVINNILDQYGGAYK